MEDLKKKYSQFFFIFLIADFMVTEASHKGAKAFLDPAVGMGAFTQCANKSTGLSITACEIDPIMIQKYHNANKYEANIICDDYLTHFFDHKFDCIVCNPPYNKFQDIENRETYKDIFQKQYSIKMSGYSNLCVYFLIKSINELNEYGRCCYIIPYEFLNTGYGKVIKEYLLKTQMLEKIIKFNHDTKVFDDAITTSCIIVLENTKHDKVEFISIGCIDELTSHNFDKIQSYRYNDLDPGEKWISYFDTTDKQTNMENIVKVSCFGRVSRGIATGANEFFALSLSDIKTLKLSKDACIHCLTKSPDVNDVVVTDRTISELIKNNKKVFLFDGTLAKSTEDHAYIQYGEQCEYNNRYLTKNRTPWYSIENKKGAPILISVFNRNRIKIIRNETGVKHLTTFHGLYLNNTDPDFANLFFCYLITPFAQRLLYMSHREYGEGLDKFEPGDLTKANMLDLNVISKEDKRTIMTIYHTIKDTQKLQEIDKLDSIFKKYV